jgi:hypothetical protein
MPCRSGSSRATSTWTRRRESAVHNLRYALPAALRARADQLWLTLSHDQGRPDMPQILLRPCMTSINIAPRAIFSIAGPTNLSTILPTTSGILPHFWSTN